MISRSLAGLALAVTVLVAAPACQRDLTDLEEAEFPGNAEIFIDGYAEGVTYQAFAGSKFDAVVVDQTVFYQGSSALRIDVPVPTDPGGSYAGGAFTSSTLRDLTEYNAVTFWARATMPAQLNVAGLGNNNTGESLYTAETYNLQLTTSWQQYAIPFPLASKLDQEDGLFFFAEGAEEGNAYSFWIDELQFADLNTIANPQPVIADSLANVDVGDTVVVAGASVTYEVSGQDITVAAAPAYFSYTSSDESVATVDELGQIVIVGEGTADITASLGSVAATGTVTVTTEGGGDAIPPSAPAPDPTQDPADVISIYSDSYTDVPNEGYARYGAAQFNEVDVAGSGNSALNYVFVSGQDGNFQLIELGGANQIDLDAAGMTNFRFDAYFPNPVNASTEFLLKLVDIGASTTEAAITVDGSSDPAIAQGTWLSFDFTLSELAALGLGGTSDIQQVVVDLRTSGEVYLDNIYFYSDSGTGGAQVDLPVTFDDPTVDYGLTDFGGTASSLVADPTDASNTVAQTVKSGTAETWAGTTVGGDEGLASPVPFTASATTMTVRVYSPDAGIPVRLKVENAADPTQSVETEAVTTAAGSWETLTFDFSNEATGTAALNLSYTYDKASIFFNFGTGGATAGEKVYLWDDVEFGGSGGVATEPTAAAPAPTQDPADVISMFSDTYTDVTVDTWRTDWSAATLEDVTIDGSAMKKYTALDFVGVTTENSQIDATGMTHFHLDIWTPDATLFAVKLVDYGANGVYQGGDDTEFQVDFDGTANPAPTNGQWMSLDIPLSDFTGMDLANIAQMILVGQPTGATTVFVDNVYFYNDGGTGGAQVDLPITFDDPAVDYVLTDFGGTASTLAADPMDASNTVAETVKTSSAELWAGTTMSGDGGLASPIPFTTTATTMTVRVYSPDAGIPVRLKVEDAADPTRSVETEAVTTVADTWETLTFDFSNEATGTAALNLSYTYDKASIFFNFGTTGAMAGEKVYLWDDVSFQN